MLTCDVDVGAAIFPSAKATTCRTTAIVLARSMSKCSSKIVSLFLSRKPLMARGVEKEEEDIATQQNKKGTDKK